MIDETDHYPCVSIQHARNIQKKEDDCWAGFNETLKRLDELQKKKKPSVFQQFVEYRRPNFFLIFLFVCLTGFDTYNLICPTSLYLQAHDIHRPCVEEFGLWIFQGDSCVCGCCYCFLWQWARSVAQAVTKENV